MAVINDKRELALALRYLEVSFTKISKRDLLAKTSWTDDELEILESFAARFARASDLAVKRYLRSMALGVLEPGERPATLRDLLNLAEKHGWIASAGVWLRIRELRNQAVHQYHTENLVMFYREFAALTPAILSLQVEP